MTSRPVSPETSNSLIRAWLGLYKNCPFRAILGAASPTLPKSQSSARTSQREFGPKTTSKGCKESLQKLAALVE
jgi:hypothetical protein